MPAPGRRPASVRKPLTGGRLTSLEGGNRVMLARGHGRLALWGFEWWLSDAGCQSGSSPRCHSLPPAWLYSNCVYFPAHREDKRTLLDPSTKRCPYRAWSISV